MQIISEVYASSYADFDKEKDISHLLDPVFVALKKKVRSQIDEEKRNGKFDIEFRLQVIAHNRVIPCPKDEE